MPSHRYPTATWPQGKVRCSAWAIADSGAGIKAVPWPHGPPLFSHCLWKNHWCWYVLMQKLPQHCHWMSLVHNDWFMRLLFFVIGSIPSQYPIPISRFSPFCFHCEIQNFAWYGTTHQHIPICSWWWDIYLFHDNVTFIGHVFHQGSTYFLFPGKERERE